MRVFTILPLRHWRDAGPAAKAAEAAGFDAVMTVELRHDPFTPLAFAALATRTVELTPSVAIAFPRSPDHAWRTPPGTCRRTPTGVSCSAWAAQVKGHNERRFGIAWTPPAPRMRDYVLALRAVWRPGRPADG